MLCFDSLKTGNGYVPGFVHSFVGYHNGFRHVLGFDLGCSGAGFRGRSLFGVGIVDPPLPLVFCVLNFRVVVYDLVYVWIRSELF